MKKSQVALLLALLVQRVNTQIRRPGEASVRRLHSDQGGEFESKPAEEFCQRKRIVHSFTDRAQHQSNGLVERTMGQLDESDPLFSPVTSQPICGPRWIWPCATELGAQ